MGKKRRRGRKQKRVFSKQNVVEVAVKKFDFDLKQEVLGALSRHQVEMCLELYEIRQIEKIKEMLDEVFSRRLDYLRRNSESNVSVLNLLMQSYQRFVDKNKSIDALNYDLKQELWRGGDYLHQRLKVDERLFETLKKDFLNDFEQRYVFRASRLAKRAEKPVFNVLDRVDYLGSV